MRPVIIISSRQDFGRSWAHHHGLRVPGDARIVTEAHRLEGLEGIRRNPEHGLLALYADGWHHIHELDRFIEMLRARGFNGPFDGG